MSESSSSASSSHGGDATVALTSDLKDIITQTVLSNVTVDLSNLVLDCAVRVTVDQKIKVRIPLEAVVSFDDDADIVQVESGEPVIEQVAPVEQEVEVEVEQEPVSEPVQEKVESASSSSASSAASEAEEQVEQAPVDPVFTQLKSTCSVEVWDLPRMDGRFGKADPYFKFYIDGIHQYGGPDMAKRNCLSAKWEPGFPLRNRQLQNARLIKIEFWDKDRFNRDDLIGVVEFSGEELFLKKQLTDLKVKGVKSDKAGTAMKITLT